jgi:hypothetical protein
MRRKKLREIEAAIPKMTANQLIEEKVKLQILGEGKKKGEKEKGGDRSHNLAH